MALKEQYIKIMLHIVEIIVTECELQVGKESGCRYAVLLFLVRYMRRRFLWVYIAIYPKAQICNTHS